MRENRSKTAYRPKINTWPRNILLSKNSQFVPIFLSKNCGFFKYHISEPCVNYGATCCKIRGNFFYCFYGSSILSIVIPPISSCEKIQSQRWFFLGGVLTVERLLVSSHHWKLIILYYRNSWMTLIQNIPRLISNQNRGWYLLGIE